MKVKKLGLKYYPVEHEEVFRFGAGSPVLSTRAYVYPVTVYKEKSWVRIAKVANTAEESRGMPRSHRTFRVGQVAGADRLRQPQGRHWRSLGANGDASIATSYPELAQHSRRESEGRGVALHSFALAQEALEASSISGDSVDIEPKLAFQWGHMDVEMALWQEGMEDEALQVLDKMGGPKKVFKVIERPRPEEEDDSSLGNISERESETSHDDGLEDPESDSTDTETEDEEMMHQALAGDISGELEIFNKGQRR